MVKTLPIAFWMLLSIYFNCYSQKLETDFEKLIGEDILFLPISDPKLDIKFDCFFTDSLCTKPLKQFNFQIRHNVENNIFKVLNNYKLLNFGPGLSRTYVTKLRSSKTGVIYLKVDFANSGDPNSLSFYLTGFAHNRHLGNPIMLVKKLETYKKNVGETFIAKTSLKQEDFKTPSAINGNYYLNEMVDIKTGAVLTISEYDVFKCVDLQLFSSTNSVFKQPYLILENEMGDHFKVYLSNDDNESHFLQKKLSLSNFYTSKQYDAILEVNRSIEESRKAREREAEEAAQLHKKECIRLFGKAMGSMIAEGKVRIGMTEKMCLYSWGEPDDINRTITRHSVTEQWIYGIGTYLYFENDILVAIQD